jgi:hypothetical protein
LCDYNFTSVTCEKSVSLPNTTDLLQVLRFPPAVTLDPQGMTCIGPPGRTV